MDGWDFLVWKRGGSPSPSTSSGDYAIWQSHYGTRACVLPEGEGLFIRTNDEEYDFLMPIEIRELTIKVDVDVSK